MEPPRMLGPDHERVSSFLHAMVSRDMETLAEVLHVDVVWRVPPSTPPEFCGPYQGITKVLAFITNAGGSLFVKGSQVLEILNLLVEGDQAAAQFRMKARTVSGIDYDNLYAFFFRLEADRIIEVWENVDTGYVYRIFQNLIVQK